MEVKASQGQINSWVDGLAAFGIGAVAGAVGAYTGGVAFAAAGGAAAGAGGFLAGAASGMVGTAFASPIQSIGNSMYFGDPMMTGKQYLTGIAIGGVFGGVINGSVALWNGKTFWTGSSKTPSIAPNTISNLNAKIEEPQVKSINNTEEISTYNSSYQNPTEIKLPNQLSHYTPEDPTTWTSIGLVENEPIYLTPNSELSRVSAINDLALTKAPNFRIDINTTDINFDLNNVMFIRRVTGNVFGQGGGGWEIIYKGPLNLDQYTITITKLP